MTKTAVHLFGRQVFEITHYKGACILHDLETGVWSAITHEIAQNIIESAKQWKMKQS